jgi:anti-anti-sigma factor
MTSAPLTTTSVPALRATATLSGAVAIIAFRGRLDTDNAFRAGAQLHALIEAGGREILVDLTETTHLDPAGIGAVAEAAHSVHDRGGHLYVFRAHGQPRELLDRSHIASAFGVVAD